MEQMKTSKPRDGFIPVICTLPIIFLVLIGLAYVAWHTKEIGYHDWLAAILTPAGMTLGTLGFLIWCRASDNLKRKKSQ
jgi:hypothetical protein